MTSYSGKIIRKTPVTPTQTSASGVWTTADAAAAVKNNLWPVPGVPDPISRSLRFRASATAYLTRTYGTPTNNKIWTWSAWIKRGSLSLADANHLFMASPQDIGSNPTTYSRLVLETDNTLRLQSANSAGEAFTSSAVFRDPSAWYHIVLTMNAASTVVNCYVNGVEISYASRTNPTNTNTAINGSGNYHRMGLFRTAEPRCFDGYMAEVNFIDGQALTPLSFGTTNAQTGAWIPMPYTGTYGANGFYLNFKDNTSTTTLGYDYSGNANNWNTTNFSVTSGVTYDSMLDVPTSWIGYSATTDTTAVTRGNFAVLNPLDTGSNGTVSAGNLTHTSSGGITRSNATIRIPSSGKFYAEFVNSSATNASIGIGFGVSADSVSLSGNSSAANSYHFYASANGYAVNNGSLTAISSWTNLANQTFQLAVDVDNGKVWIGQNNVWWNSAGGSTGNPSTGANPTFTIATSGFKVFTYLDPTGSVNWQATFGQRPFTYTPPTGFGTFCTTNLSTPTIVNGASYMAASTYTGNGTTTNLVNSGNNTAALTFQPDFVWQKNRASIANNILLDSVRGGSLYLISNSTGADASAPGYMTFNSNGVSFTSSDIATNQNGQTYIAWQWKAGGSAVSNTNGTIASSVSANTTSGFSVVTYTGTGSNATVGHGLGVAPSMVIIKNRTGANDWVVGQSNMTSWAYAMNLNRTDAQTSVPTIFNSTAPTSTVFSIGTNAQVNTSSSNYVAYCFAAVTGYSAFGKYTGNGSADGPFVYCGFRPRYLMVKNASAVGSWIVDDSSTNPYNEVGNLINANTSGAEFTTADIKFDYLSNGFKVRQTNSAVNGSGNTLIFMAFAELPFNYSNAR